ncbi:hypothetical protein CPB83DRAFT_854099 [Crepidotus variabilis]|uniref:Uncharacterized protein n=1 Tax=Crepidotus variabilis TaxID=179855 RepID=A0A9P6EGI2_9AGAR|nr:hypothetical protein CPB83DRAFT_854099 [Crepidotus variabilis]
MARCRVQSSSRAAAAGRAPVTLPSLSQAVVLIWTFPKFPGRQLIDSSPLHYRFFPVVFFTERDTLHLRQPHPTFASIFIQFDHDNQHTFLASTLSIFHDALHIALHILFIVLFCFPSFSLFHFIGGQQ